MAGLGFNTLGFTPLSRSEIKIVIINNSDNLVSSFLETIDDSTSDLIRDKELNINLDENISIYSMFDSEDYQEPVIDLIELVDSLINLPPREFHPDLYEQSVVFRNFNNDDILELLLNETIDKLNSELDKNDNLNLNLEKSTDVLSELLRDDNLEVLLDNNDGIHSYFNSIIDNLDLNSDYSSELFSELLKNDTLELLLNEIVDNLNNELNNDDSISLNLEENINLLSELLKNDNLSILLDNSHNLLTKIVPIIDNLDVNLDSQINLSGELSRGEVFELNIFDRKIPFVILEGDISINDFIESDANIREYDKRDIIIVKQYEDEIGANLSTDRVKR